MLNNPGIVELYLHHQTRIICRATLRGLHKDHVLLLSLELNLVPAAQNFEYARLPYGPQSWLWVDTVSQGLNWSPKPSIRLLLRAPRDNHRLAVAALPGTHRPRDIDSAFLRDHSRAERQGNLSGLLFEVWGGPVMWARTLLSSFCCYFFLQHRHGSQTEYSPSHELWTMIELTKVGPLLSYGQAGVSSARDPPNPNHQTKSPRIVTPAYIDPYPKSEPDALRTILS